jgi:hypothetical protein
MPTREPFTRAESAVRLDANDEVLGAKSTRRAACKTAKMTRDACAVPEFEALVF